MTFPFQVGLNTNLILKVQSIILVCRFFDDFRKLNFFMKKGLFILMIFYCLIWAKISLGQSPGNVGNSNLRLWLNASNATASGTNVTRWNDQSGSNNNAVNISGSGGVVPQKIAGGLNSNAVIRFDGTRALQGTFGSAITASSLSSFIVFKMNSNLSQPYARAFAIAQDANRSAGDYGTSQGAVLFGRFNNGTNDIFSQRRNVSFPAITYGLNTPVLLSNAFSGNNFLMYNNGRQLSTTSFSATAFNAGAYAIGAGIDNGPSQFMNGDVAEVIMFNTSLSAADKNKVESYLALKYGFTLDQSTATNYVIDASTVWNAAANAGYNNNIAGIGRNDNSALSQLKSQSINPDGMLTLSVASFANNNTFIVVGDNGQTGMNGTGSGTANFPFSARRIWKTQITNTSPALTFSIDLNQSGLVPPSTGFSTSSVALLISATPIFTTASQIAPSSVINGIATFTNVTLTNASFFTVGLQASAPARGYIYLHKKALDENSSIPFSFSVSGGPSAVPNFTLNDIPDVIDVYDLGASHGNNGNNYGDGQLWAVGLVNNNSGTPHATPGTVYMRASGSSSWISTGQTAVNLDGAGYNEMVYTNNSSIAYFYTQGGTANKIYDPNNHSKVGLKDIAFGGGMTVVIDANGRVLRYNGNYSNNSDNWIDLTGISNLSTGINTIDVLPSNRTIVVQGTNGVVYTMDNNGTNLVTIPFPTGSVSAPDIADCAFDDNGKIYATYKNTVLGSDFIYSFNAATNSWVFEAQTRLLRGITGGAAGQMWASNNLKGTARGTIYSRTQEGGASWIDDERVKTNSPDNSIMLSLLPGTYTIRETIQPGWDINEIWVKDPTQNSSGSAVTGIATINVQAGEVVHVGYTNELVQSNSVINSCAASTQYLQSFGFGSATYGPIITGATPYHYVASNLPQDGYYTLEKNASTWFSPGSLVTTDHTPDSIDGGNGYLLVVNASYGIDEFYRDRLTGLIIGQSYSVGFYAANISPSRPLKPNVTFGVANINTGNFIGSVNTGEIISPSWKYYSFNFIATTTIVDIVIQNNSIGGNGNDIAIDDISFNSTPPTLLPIEGNAILCSNGSTYTFTNPKPGGVWSISNTATASINALTGLVTPVANAAGKVTITYTFINAGGCISIATKDVDVVNTCAPLPVSISGNVFNDANGLNDNTVNGVVTNGGGLNVTVYNHTSGKIQATMALPANGAYSFSDLPNGNNYSVAISTATAVVGSSVPIPIPVLPNNYVSTGENVGTNSGNDGNANGILPIGTLLVNINNANFGIEQLPAADIINAPSQMNPEGAVKVIVPTLTGSDPEDGIYNGISLTNTCVIKTLPLATQGLLYYDNVLVAPGQIIAGYDPSLLKVDPVYGDVTVVFTYSTVDAAGKESPAAIVTMPFRNDIDDDNDGITDINESCGYDPYADCDNDGTPNYQDLVPGCPSLTGKDTWGNNYKPLVWNDCNADGINDLFDFDRDGIMNEQDLDSDNDGILDVVESRPGGSPFLSVLNGQITGTDADGNGLLSSADNGENNPFMNGLQAQDFDRDGLPNFMDLDSDGDGMTDITEALGDFDTNGISNGLDTDGDGVQSEGFGNNIAAIADDLEGFGGKGLTLLDSDGDGNPNCYDIDSDNDGITDNVEGQPTCSMRLPSGNDCNGNGEDDSYDITNCNACSRTTGGINPYDKDFDTVPDYLDLDTDNDGAFDVNEGSGIFGNFVTDFSDVDKDGLIGQFDNFNIVIATSNFVNNVGHKEIGNNGDFNGYLPTGSFSKLPKSFAGTCDVQDRDWRSTFILPIRIFDFRGKEFNQQITLSWKALNEIDVKEYTIERSIDGILFKSIGVTKALNAQSAQYDYVDIIEGLNASTVFYRIKQLNKNGDVYRTHIISFSRSNLVMSNVKLFPNPVKAFVMANFNSNEKQRVEISIYSVEGKKMQSRLVTAEKGSNTIMLDHLEQLSPGAYLLNVILREKTLYARFVK